MRLGLRCERVSERVEDHPTQLRCSRSVVTVALYPRCGTDQCLSKAKSCNGTHTLGFTVSGERGGWTVRITSPGGITIEDETTERHWHLLFNEMLTKASRRCPSPQNSYQIPTPDVFITFDLPDGLTLAQSPLPPALPLFATGLGALGLLGWRRKRKKYCS